MTDSNQKESQSIEPATKTDILPKPFLFGVALVIIATIAGWYQWIYSPSVGGFNRNGQAIIVIDTAKIISAATKYFLSKNNINTGAEASKMAISMQAAIDEYRQEGMLILNSYSVLYVPPEMDKTSEVADKIGVPLE